MRFNQYIKEKPFAKQLAYMLLPHQEALYGGRAGGGKSSALLSIALGYVHIPGYSCIIFRRTLTDLKQPGALLSRAHEWLKGTDARWAGDEHIYYFPTRGPDGEPAEPAKIAFGYMGESNIRNRYKSAEYQMLIWDELTEFDIEDYLFMFSRLRAKACPIHKTGDDGKPAWDDKCGWCSLYRQLPLKVRSATNPGSVGHAWVKDRFRITPGDPNVREWEIPNDATEVEWVGKHPDRPFLQADYRDNPFIIQEDYAKSLDNLPPLERARFKYGNWAANFDARFDRRWARYYSTLGDYFVLGRDSVGDSFHWKDLKRVFGTVDPATSLKEGLSEKAVYNRDPSRTVISIWGLTENNDLLWLDIDYFQEEAPVVVERMKRMYQKWRPVYFKMETNGPGKPIAQYASLAGIPITMNKKYRDKVSNSITAQVKMKAGKIWLPQTAPWLKDVEDEVFNWIGSPSQKDDIVDTLSDAANDVLWESGDETATYMQDGMQVATEAPIYVPL
jgi:predicted phage terminase large subunit-like protein